MGRVRADDFVQFVRSFSFLTIVLLIESLSPLSLCLFYYLACRWVRCWVRW